MNSGPVGRQSGLTLKRETGYAPSPRHTVVEIGCGIGRLTRAIAPEVGRVIAMDISENMLAIAREANLPNVDFIEASGFSLPHIPRSISGFCTWLLRFPASPFTCSARVLSGRDAPRHKARKHDRIHSVTARLECMAVAASARQGLFARTNSERRPKRHLQERVGRHQTEYVHSLQNEPNSSESLRAGCRQNSLFWLPLIHASSNSEDDAAHHLILKQQNHKTS